MAGKLTAAFVRTVNKPGRYGDGHGGYGLALIVRPRADGGVRKSWAQRLRMPTGQITNLGIGPYPVVSLSEARAAALANRRATFRGEDPRGSGAVTFSEAAAAVIAQRSETWRDPRSAGNWASALERYAFPAFGTKPVGEVTSADVLAAVSPLWGTKRETARKLLGRIRAVMAWAIAANLRPDDPTGAVTAALPKNGNGVKHHKALPASAVGDAIAAVQSSGAWWATMACYELIALTGVRSGEARGAVWSEVDLEAETWSIPPERYKTATGLRVPLSGPAVAILAEARRRTGGGGLVFPRPDRAAPERRHPVQAGAGVGDSGHRSRPAGLPAVVVRRGGRVS